MSCAYYTWKGGVFGDYWCTKNEASVSSDIYYKYCRDYNYSSCPIYKHHESSGCFITTVTCGILKKKENDSVLKNLRYFRNNVLQTNQDYYETLKEYDSIGPVIAFKLLTDKDNKKIAEALYNNVLTTISDLVKEQKNDEAVEKYKVMTLLLINYYGLKRNYNHEVDNNYHYNDFDAKKAGHGYQPIKKKN